MLYSTEYAAALCHGGAVTDSPHSFQLRRSLHAATPHGWSSFPFFFFLISIHFSSPLFLLIASSVSSSSTSTLGHLLYFYPPFDFRHEIINLWPYLHPQWKKINDPFRRNSIQNSWFYCVKSCVVVTSLILDPGNVQVSSVRLKRKYRQQYHFQ